MDREGGTIKPEPGEYLLLHPRRESYYGKVYVEKGNVIVQVDPTSDTPACYLSYRVQDEYTFFPLFPVEAWKIEEMKRIIHHVQNNIREKAAPSIHWQIDQEWLAKQVRYSIFLKSVLARMEDING